MKAEKKDKEKKIKVMRMVTYEGEEGQVRDNLEHSLKDGKYHFRPGMKITIETLKGEESEQ